MFGSKVSGSKPPGSSEPGSKRSGSSMFGSSKSGPERSGSSMFGSNMSGSRRSGSSRSESKVSGSKAPGPSKPGRSENERGRWSRALRPSWWAPQRWDLRRGFIASLGLHLVFVAAVTVLARPRFQPPERTDVIPVELVSLPAPVQPVAPTPPRPEPTAPDVVPDPLAKKPPPKKKPPVKPPEPEKKPVKKEETPKKPVETKKGKIEPDETPPPVKPPERPALGDEPASVEIELEGPAFEYDYYVRLIRRKISSRWQPEASGAKPGAEMSAVVRFRILRDGRVSDDALVEAAESPLFNQSVLRALRLAAPLPPLPAEYPQDWLGVKLKFVYRE
jgi:protein TonB